MFAVVLFTDYRKENSFKLDCVYDTAEKAIKRATEWASKHDEESEMYIEPINSIFNKSFTNANAGLSWSRGRVAVMKICVEGSEDQIVQDESTDESDLDV